MLRLKTFISSFLIFRVIVYDRWVSNYNRYKSEFLQENLPSILRSLAPAVLQKNFKKQLFAQGMGRHRPDEVNAIGRNDIIALSEFLDEKTFIMGDKPCTVCGDNNIMLYLKYSNSPK